MADIKDSNINNTNQQETKKRHSFFGGEINQQTKDLLDFRYNTQEEIDKLNEEMQTNDELDNIINDQNYSGNNIQINDFDEIFDQNQEKPEQTSPKKINNEDNNPTISAENNDNEELTNESYTNEQSDNINDESEEGGDKEFEITEEYSSKFFDPFELSIDEKESSDKKNDIFDPFGNNEDVDKEGNDENINKENNENNDEELDDEDVDENNDENNEELNDEDIDENNDENNEELNDEDIDENNDENNEELNDEDIDENNDKDNEKLDDEDIDENNNENNDEDNEELDDEELDDEDVDENNDEDNEELDDEDVDENNDEDNEELDDEDVDENNDEDNEELNDEDVDENNDEDNEELDDEDADENNDENNNENNDSSNTSKGNNTKQRKIMSTKNNMEDDNELDLGTENSDTIEEDEDYQPSAEELFEQEPEFFGEDDISQQFLQLVKNSRSIFKLNKKNGNTDGYFKILGGKNNDSKLEYLFYLIEEPDEPIDLFIKKVETDEISGEETEHLVQFSYNNEKLLNIFVDEIILYEAVNKAENTSSEYNDTKAILEKFVFLTQTYYDELKSEIDREREELKKKRQLQQIFKGF